MPEADRLPLANGIWVARSDLDFSASRAGGPGGQHVNTADSRMTLRLPIAAIQGGDAGFRARLRAACGQRLTDDDEIVLHCQESRSQHRNRELVTQRLIALVAACATPPKRRRPTRPSRAAVERRLQDKGRRSQTKQRRRDRDFD